MRKFIGAVTRAFFPDRWLKHRNERFRTQLGSIGRPVRIADPVLMCPLDRIRIGSNVVIHENSYFQAEGGISIGDNVAISVRCVILTTNHRYDGPGWDALPWSEQSDHKPVSIEDNVWIGMNVTILPGVTIHEGAVVGAGSVVTADVAKCAVVAGNPAQQLKTRDIARYEELKTANKVRAVPTDTDIATLVSN